jgi:molecular chaperone DnaK
MTSTIPIGIDLGTTNSVVATVSSGGFEVIPNARGDKKTPSVVSYDQDTGKVFAGKQADNRAIQYPEKTVKSVKRHMGTDETFSLGPDKYHPEEISGLILQKLIEDAEDELGRSLSTAVITVPAYFSDAQRRATKRAGEIAGVDVDRVLPEPTAACLAYGLQSTAGKRVLVYDLGGGTFDCSAVKIDDGVIETLGVDGATDLGGDDYDGLIVKWMADTIEDEHGSPPALNDPKVNQRLFGAAKEVKHTLSNQKSATQQLPFLELQNGDSIDYQINITRGEFAEITAGPTQETIDIMNRFLNDLGLSPSQFDDILLVGGATRMPTVRSAVEQFFGQEPRTDLNPDQIVALGAATQAAILEDIEVPEVSTTNIVPATGASEKEAAISEGSNPILIDALPRTLGVELQEPDTTDTYFQPLIQSGESIPARAEINVSPVRAHQTKTKFTIYQGDEGTLEGNEEIGELVLGPYPPKELEEYSQRATMEIDSDGIITFTAVSLDADVSETTKIETQFDRAEETLGGTNPDLPALHR